MLIIASLDTLTSLLSGFIVFGILGNLAMNMGETDVFKVLSSGGSGLAFIGYPEVISKFPAYRQVG